MRALALHADVLVATSAVLHVNCVLVRGAGPQGAQETFAIDSPVLPEELGTLAPLLEQARFPPPAGLLATHADWDHLLARLAFPEAALGCARSTARRLAAAPGVAQRELRAFDEELLIERERPLSLGAVQALPVPGHCAVGAQELELHPAEGHTGEGMAIVIPWASVLVAGDYLSAVELPSLGEGATIAAYLATLERLEALLARVEHVVPGHGPVVDPERAAEILAEDRAYLRSLAEHGAGAELPERRRGPAQRRAHEKNVARTQPAR
ncbi:MAG TPA: MBL fold metallo-hydrolase [Solirubrobacteraceae bacterium]|nr:MBL fold metallo-hydrolase [Solirubrobacteraceae bacterium]